MKYVLAVDQSTSGTKAALLDEHLRTVRSARRAHRQFYPQPGWVEHDAEEIWENTAALLLEVSAGVEAADIAGIGIANQRETTVLWERGSGRPLCLAVVWQDVRAKAVTDALAASAGDIYRETGLLPSPYYSAAKAAHILRASPELLARARQGQVCFGTVDSFLLYRLTGGRRFATDLSNAGRTQLLNIHTRSWSPELAGLFGLPVSLLPEELLPSDGDFGPVETLPALKGVPVAAMLGDSNASLFAHGCTEPGMVKTSYGTGSSLMMCVGSTPVLSKNGLSASIGFSRGDTVSYVLEGNITCSADTLMWLKDGLGLIRDMDELEQAASVSGSEGVYLVPAFAGLGAPWFEERAKAILYGMNRGTTKAHVLYAALESIAHQNADVLDAMARDTGIAVTQLYADGGGSVNPLLMQMQSDLTPCTVIVSGEKDLTIRGAGLMAGLSRGLFACPPAAEPPRIYHPAMAAEQREALRQGWLDALRRCR